MIKEKKFAEWAKVHNSYYGTSKNLLLKVLKTVVEFQYKRPFFQPFHIIHSKEILPSSYLQYDTGITMCQ